jgi:hypothetical protein
MKSCLWLAQLKINKSLSNFERNPHFAISKKFSILSFSHVQSLCRTRPITRGHLAHSTVRVELYFASMERAIASKAMSLTRIS